MLWREARVPTLTLTPTPNPSPQGGGEQTERTARLYIQRKWKCLSCFLTILSNHVGYPLGGNTHSQLIGGYAETLVCCVGLLGGM